MNTKRLLITPFLIAAALHGQDVPRPAPSLTIQLPGGNAVSLTDYKGKVILLAGLLTT
jgi:hypothetical protein